jgi:hypothetical protein
MLLKPGSPPFDYKASIAEATTEREEWKMLLSMGRPLWKSYVNKKDSVESQQADVIGLAASKLLVGLPPDLSTSYDDSTWVELRRCSVASGCVRG